MTKAKPKPHDWRPQRFMVIAAHPDDADFGPAATAARWIDEGSVGWLVCCTSGDQGGEDPDFDPLELAAIREREQRAAAEVVGYEGVTFLHMPDGALVNDLILREHLVRAIRTFRPDAVLATDPENAFPRDGGVNHTDHRAAGWAAADAVYPAARNPMAFPSLREERAGEARRPPAVLLLDASTERLRRHHDDRRPEARRPALPREPDPGVRGGREVDPRVVRDAGQGGRRRERRRVLQRGHRRRRGAETRAGRSGRDRLGRFPAVGASAERPRASSERRAFVTKEEGATDGHPPPP